MFTINYKGWYINGYCDRPGCTIVLPTGGVWCRAKTLIGAKRIITKAKTWVNCSESGVVNVSLSV